MPRRRGPVGPGPVGPGPVGPGPVGPGPVGTRTCSDQGDQDGRGRWRPRTCWTRTARTARTTPAKPGRLFGSMRLLGIASSTGCATAHSFSWWDCFLGGLVLGLVTSSTTWPSTSDRAEVLTALGSIAAPGAAAAQHITHSRHGSIAFASGLYSPRNAARLLARPLVIWSTGLFVAVLGWPARAALALLLRDSGELSVLPFAVSAALFAISLLGFLAVNVDMTGILSRLERRQRSHPHRDYVRSTASTR